MNKAYKCLAGDMDASLGEARDGLGTVLYYIQCRCHDCTPSKVVLQEGPSYTIRHQNTIRPSVDLLEHDVSIASHCLLLSNT